MSDTLILDLNFYYILGSALTWRQLGFSYMILLCFSVDMCE